MKRTIDNLLRGHLGHIFVTLTAVWAVSIFILTPAQIVKIENSFLIATGLGIGIAYFPAALGAVRSRMPSQGELLALGIWLAWIATACERAYSLVWRALGKDISFLNTNLHTGIVFLIALGGVCHLVAPEVIDGRFPRRGWMVLGATAAAATAVIAMVALGFGL